MKAITINRVKTGSYMKAITGQNGHGLGRLATKGKIYLNSSIKCQKYTYRCSKSRSYKSCFFSSLMI
ncbi:hypothetical protein Hanom_Chr11g00970301 [Helianthus anomalus]